MKGRPPSKTTKTTRATSKPKFEEPRKPRNAAVSNKKSSSPPSSASGGHSNFDQENVACDPSEANFPYDIRFNGVSSLLNMIHKATPDVKDLLMDECEIILECRVCRNLFRSFPNFLSHKQHFCKVLYNPATQSKYGPLLNCAENLYQLQYHMDTALTQTSYANSTDSGVGSVSSTVSNQDISPETTIKCSRERLENIVDKIKSSEGVQEESGKSQKESKFNSKTGSRKRKPSSPMKTPSENENGVSFPCLFIEPLLNRAKDGIAFQTWLASDEEINCDKFTRAGTKENTAVLDVNGKMIYVGAEEGAETFLNQISSENLSERNDLLDFQCSLCQTQFYSEKTLRLHSRKANCKSIRKESITTDSDVFKNKKRRLDFPEGSLKTRRNGFPLNKTFTINSSPRKSLIVKRSKTDYNTAKENKSIIRSIFGPTKQPPKTTKLKIPTNESETTLIKTNSNKAEMQATMKPKWKIDYSNKYEAEKPTLPSPATCRICSSSFPTKSEMSSHLASCTGVINLAHKKGAWSPEQKKICIQIRHSYGKSQSVNSEDSANESTQQITTTNLKTESSRQNQSSSFSEFRTTTATLPLEHTGHFNNNVNETKPMEVESSDFLSDNQQNLTKDLSVSVDKPLDLFLNN